MDTFSSAIVGNIGQSYYQSSSDMAAIEDIKRGAKSEKEQLKKVSSEFESIFIAKMLTELDKTVDREGSMFQESKYLDNLKSFMYNDIARQIAADEHANLGIARRMYAQLEKTVKE